MQLGVTGSGVRGGRPTQGCCQCAGLQLYRPHGRALGGDWYLTAWQRFGLSGAKTLHLPFLTGLCFLPQEPPGASMGA